jgi:hypothetical protein
MRERAADTGADERPPAGRWVTRADEGSPEARAGALLRQAVRREELEAGRLAAIRRRLRDGRRGPQRHWALRLAIAIALLLSGGALTAAGQRYLGWLAPAPPAPPAPAAEPLPQARRARTAASPLAPVPAAPAETTPPSDPTPGLHAPAEAARPSVPARPPFAPAAVAPAAVTPPPAATSEPAPVFPAASSALAQESALLVEALRKLRQGDDPRGALALLDEHDVLFPGGVLAPEAMLARIEALIRIHRNRDALSLLDQTAPSPRGSGRELLIARAELRAAAGRCAAAAADFNLLLRRDPPADPITERALWGRAACRATAGDGAGARSDLKDYLALFPEGRFAREARKALEP